MAAAAGGLMDEALQERLAAAGKFYMAQDRLLQVRRRAVAGGERRALHPILAAQRLKHRGLP